MTIDPAALGYFEKTPGSDLWYRSAKSAGYTPRTCPVCGREYMGQVAAGRGCTCSRACGKRKPVVGYQVAHQRVRKARGPATEYACTDCGQSAAEWSQIHGTTGLLPDHYQPRCRTCHSAYDAETRPRGEAVGTSRLTDAKVRGIWASTGAAGVELAKTHGISTTAVSRIRLGKTWKHLTGGRKAEW